MMLMLMIDNGGCDGDITVRVLRVIMMTMMPMKVRIVEVGVVVGAGGGVVVLLFRQLGLLPAGLYRVHPAVKFLLPKKKQEPLIHLLQSAKK